MLFEEYNLTIIGSGIINNIPNQCQYALDIGGTLIKLVYILNPSTDNLLKCEENCIKENFKNIESITKNNNTIFFCLLGSINQNMESQIENIFRFLIDRKVYKNNIVPMTGGGSLKYKSIIESKYKIKVIHYDEIQTIVKGYIQLIENSSRLLNQSLHYYCISENETILNNINSDTCIFPTLIISVGSGVSIIRVKNKYEFERVSGTRFGGGTVFGVLRLFGINDFSELMKLYSNFEKKNHENNQCFFKEFLNDYQFKKDIEFKENIVYNIVNMMYSDLSYLICLISSKYKNQNIVFCGNYVSNHHKIIINCIKKYSYLVNNKINVFFHYLDGFFGAIGAYFSHKDL